MLSPSGMSLSNELSSVLLKVSHKSASRGSPPKESIGGLTLFRSHLSKLLSAVGSIFQILCPLEGTIL